MKEQCSICLCQTDSETAAILTMGGFASPCYLCPECEADIEAATFSRDFEQAYSAMDRISKKMTDADIEDKAVLKTVKEIMTEAAARAEKIKSGEYDFSEEESETDKGDEEIPEELRETEEDRELDRKEAEANKKIDKITNWVCLALVGAAAAFLIYKIVETYLL